MAETMGWEIKEEEIPPNEEDFPRELFIAYSIYDKLPSTYAGMGGYAGKSYTNIEYLFRLHDVPTPQHLFYLNLISWLDSRTIRESNEQLKRASKTK